MDFNCFGNIFSFADFFDFSYRRRLFQVGIKSEIDIGSAWQHCLTGVHYVRTQTIETGSRFDSWDDCHG